MRDIPPGPPDDGPSDDLDGTTEAASLSSSASSTRPPAWVAPPPQPSDPSPDPAEGAPSSLALLFARLGRECGERPAIVEADGRAISFGGLNLAAAALADELGRAGIGPGAPVVVRMPSGIPLFVALIGVAASGATVVLVESDLPWRLFARLVARVRPMALVADPPGQLLRLLVPELRDLRCYASSAFVPLPHVRIPIAGVPGGRGLEELAASDARSGESAERSSAPALITFGAARTGSGASPTAPLPSAVPWSSEALSVLRKRWLELLRPRPGEVDMPQTPLAALGSLSAGVTTVLPGLHRGKLALAETARVVSLMQRHRVTTTSGTPAFFEPLARYLLDTGTRLGALRTIHLGGARVPSRLLEDLAATVPSARVHLVYGTAGQPLLAEVDAVEVLAAGGDRRGFGPCVGRPVPGVDLRLARPDADVLAGEGEMGEVVMTRWLSGVRGPGGPQETEDATAEALPDHPRHWLRTGHLGRFDSEGRLYLLGRVGDSVDELQPWVVAGLAETLPFVRRAALCALDGRAALAVELAKRLVPGDWREIVRETTGVWRVEAVRRLPPASKR